MTETGAPRYEKVEILYDVPTGRGVLRAERQAAFDPSGSPAAESVDDPAGALLKVEFPHPDGDRGRARATLRLYHGPRPDRPDPESLTGKLRSVFKPAAFRADAVDPEEIRVYDFPKQQLDLLLVDLANSGFFDDQRRPEGEGRMRVSIDRGQTAKTWTRDPRLDDLILRARRRGHRVAR